MSNIVLWLARSMMFLMVYMYHSYVSILHLSWILMSFVFPIQTTFVISIYGVLPILFWEFIFIYAIRIPVV
jgi:hypothetical protein